MKKQARVPLHIFFLSLPVLMFKRGGDCILF